MRLLHPVIIRIIPRPRKRKALSMRPTSVTILRLVQRASDAPVRPKGALRVIHAVIALGVAGLDLGPVARAREVFAGTFVEA